MLVLGNAASAICRRSIRQCSSYMKNYIDVHPEVANALKKNEPLVALESTIITHGMPFPSNLETALEVEDIVRTEGATPATIAIIDGRIKVGLGTEELKLLARMNRDNVFKVSRRDFSFVLSKHLSGGTTVAGTMVVADMVGLKVFATGGIGGVHRHGQDTLDISADLIELGRTPIAVVSSGVKSILDIPRTLEFLETQGVSVCSYQCPDHNFPDFYTSKSDTKVPYNLTNPKEAAELIATCFALKLRSGMLIGVPVPEQYAIQKSLIDTAIAEALKDAECKNVKGKEITPFLLAAIAKITKGKSLEANIALIKNNAKTAAQIAKELYQPQSKKSTASIKEKENIPIIIGASILDLCLTVEDDFKLNGATYHVNSRLYGGGVGRNLAEGISKLHGPVNFLSAIGQDNMGKTLADTLPKQSVSAIFADTDKLTSICSVIIDKYGDCKLILGNMNIHEAISPELVRKHKEQILQAPIVIIDGNLSLPTMKEVLKVAKESGNPVFYEPTDMRIAGKPFQLSSSLGATIKFISPNIYELQEIANVLKNGHVPIVDLSKKEDLLKNASILLKSINEHFDCIILTLGELGVIVDRNNTSDCFFDSNNGKYIPCKPSNRSTRYYPAEKVDNLVNVSGAGDSFSSGFIAKALQGKNEFECVSAGFAASRKALQTESAVPENYFMNENERKSIYKFVQSTWSDMS